MRKSIQMDNIFEIIREGIKSYWAATVGITSALITADGHAATLSDIYNQNPFSFLIMCISVSWVIWQFAWSIHDRFWNIGHRREEDNDPLSQHRRHTDPELDTPDLPEENKK